MFRIREPALKLIMFCWETAEAYKYGYKTNYLTGNLTSWVDGIVWS